VEIQAYCAIIACLLIALWTGKQPTKRTYEMICLYFIGWADEEELLATSKNQSSRRLDPVRVLRGRRRSLLRAIRLPTHLPHSKEPRAYRRERIAHALLRPFPLTAIIEPNRIGQRRLKRKGIRNFFTRQTIKCS